MRDEDPQKTKQVVVVQKEDSQHIPQWAVKALIAFFVLIVGPGTVSIVSYVVGGIHARIGDNEKDIQTLKERQAAVDARADKNEDTDKAQWRLLGELKDEVGKHH